MKRTRLHTADDSLDLMLDAICNVFGGILLLAILVVLQTRVSVQDLSRQSDLEIQMERLQMEVDKTAEQVQVLHGRRDILETSYRREHPEEKEEVLKTQQTWSDQSRKQILLYEEAQNKLSQAQQVLSEYEMKIMELDSKIEVEQAQNKSLQNRADEVEQATSEHIRLPRFRIDYSKNPIYFVIQGGKIYALGSEHQSGRGSYISKECRITPLKSVFGGVKIEPIEGKGIRTPKTLEEGVPFLGLIRDFSPKGFFIYFFVSGDDESFADFQLLKKILLNDNYLYGVSAYRPEKGLIAYYGTPSVQ